MILARLQTETGEIRCVYRGEDGAWYRLSGTSLLEPGEPTGVRQYDGTLLAPVDPVCILGIGMNDRDHAAEIGRPVPEEPVLFMKAPSALQHPEQPIQLPQPDQTESVDCEAELAVVIGRRARDLSREEALDYVAGFTCANDVSARNWQGPRGGGQFCRAKTFDTFCPLGPVLVTPESLRDSGDLPVISRINGETLQSGSTRNQIFDVPELLHRLSQDTTLEPGTVLLTGTPPGVGWARSPERFLRPGDVVEVEIPRIGILSNPVVGPDGSTGAG
jgi:2-keto-4-pentenoate hydratase/2-oxohepta-3-ene-1,7-dioic acid hydratase in catechol pathway